MLLITLGQIWNVPIRKDQPWEELTIIFFHLKTDYLHLKTRHKDQSGCLKKQLKWNKVSFFSDGLSGKIFHGINIANSVSEKITQEEQSPLIKRQVVWRIYSEQMTEKQKIVLKLAPSPPKKRKTFHRWKSL